MPIDGTAIGTVANKRAKCAAGYFALAARHLEKVHKDEPEDEGSYARRKFRELSAKVIEVDKRAKFISELDENLVTLKEEDDGVVNRFPTK